MKVEYLDLRADRSLLDSNFEGYHLSLDKLPVYSLEIPEEIKEVTCSNEQYSYQQIKLFSQHNHLFSDVYNLDHVYFVNTKNQLIHCTFSEDFQLSNVGCVFDIPKRELEVQAQIYSVSLYFPGPETAVLDDGYGKVYILHTGSRNGLQEWKICDSDIIESDSPSILVHSIIHQQSSDESKAQESGFNLNILLMGVVSDEGKESGDRGFHFTNILTLITLASESLTGPWKKTRTRTMTGTGTVDYAAIDSAGEAVIVASDKDYSFLTDSLKEVKKPTVDSETKKAGPLYFWSQKNEDISVYFMLPPGTAKQDVIFDLTSTRIDIAIKSLGTVLSGKLFATVVADSSTWTLTDNKLDVSLTKSDGALRWTELVIDDNRGEELLDPDLVEEIHKKLEHLTSESLVPQESKMPEAFSTDELEECDELPSDSFCLRRFCGENHEITHQINLGSHQFLFGLLRDCNAVPSICLRHDVDGLVWEFPANPTETFKVQHVMTLPAFGYILASKQQRKFISCAPDGGFYAICDVRKHLYVYRQPLPIHSTLRNRKTGKETSKISRQQLISLEDTEEIKGFTVSNKNIFIVTKNKMYTVHVD